MINISLDFGELEEGLSTIYSVGRAMTSLTLRNDFVQALANRGETAFGFYADAEASANPEKLHHVYEWGEIGRRDGRLFMMVENPPKGGHVTMWTKFRPSNKKVPLNREGEGPHTVYDSGDHQRTRHIFKWKAHVMEHQESAITEAGKAEHRVSGQAPRFLLHWQDGQASFSRRRRVYYEHTYGSYRDTWNVFWDAYGYDRVAIPVVNNMHPYMVKTGEKEIRQSIFKARSRSSMPARAPNKPGLDIDLRSQGKPVTNITIEPRPMVEMRLKRKWARRLKQIGGRG